MKRILITATMILALALTAAPSFAQGNEGKINLNTATVEQLAELPEISSELAQEIVDLRKEYGEFVDMEELMELDGVNPAMLRKLDRVLYIEPAADCNC